MSINSIDNISIYQAYEKLKTRDDWVEILHAISIIDKLLLCTNTFKSNQANIYTFALHDDADRSADWFIGTFDSLTPWCLHLRDYKENALIAREEWLTK